VPPPTSSNRIGNRLLDLLSRAEYQHLAHAVEVVSLVQGQALYRQNGPLSHVYFPKSGMLSVITVMDSGNVVETATIGREGMLGIMALLGLEVSPVTATAQVPGESVRIPVAALLQAMTPGGSLERLLRRWVAFSLQDAYQKVACNALHSVEARMCRWLLMTQDRVRREEFPLTQEFLAEMLGVRRQTVTLIARSLQGAGLITYRRGRLRVHNRAGLEECSCECYESTRRFYDRIVR
jgi:CRP-like cAMP-binding protein